MEGYSLEPRPFYISEDNSVRLFKGFSLTRNTLPIVAKRHEFSLLRDKGQLTERLNAAINAGLAQARVEHPNSCKVLEICLDLSEAPNEYYVYHILEALEKDLYQAVEQRKRRNCPYSEQEVWDFLKQTAGALSLAHEKVTIIQEISHRDIKPENVFIDSRGEYKLGDFGCYFEKKYSTLAYMSPQQRQAYLGQARQYSAFKTDVFELGMTTLAMASLDLPVEAWPLDRVDQTAVEKVQPLPFSSALKALLLEMLLEREESRPEMRAVLQTASSAVLIEASPGYLAAEKPQKQVSEGTRCVLCNKPGAVGVFSACSCYCLVCGPFLAISERRTHCGNCGCTLNTEVIRKLGSQKVKCACGQAISLQTEGHVCRNGHVLCGKCMFCCESNGEIRCIVCGNSAIPAKPRSEAVSRLLKLCCVCEARQGEFAIKCRHKRCSVCSIWTSYCKRCGAISNPSNL